jgi:hypothetical protein
MEYQMPDDTNIRRVFVDDSTNPVTFWTGSNHAHSIVKVEPLDEGAARLEDPMTGRRKPPRSFDHSKRSASIGSRRAARWAG